MHGFISLLSGVFFGLGLVISGMTQPGKVIGFLDVFGDNWQWDLMGVMGGALGVHALTRLLVIKRGTPIFGEAFPTFKTKIDKRLVMGAVIFGLGWGIAGLCPGPAIVSLVTFDDTIIIFVVMMSVGMMLAKKVTNLIDSSR